MTISHHPDDSLLLDFAAGAMKEPLALLVATHASMCPKCITTIARLERIGGVMLQESEEPGARADPGLRAAILARLDVSPPANHPSTARSAASALLPQPLQSYAGQQVAQGRWRAWGPGVEQISLFPARKDFSARLLRIRGGARMLAHGHHGEELTLVLAGGFSDISGHFLRGDVAEKGPADEHQPVADTGEDCICLAVTDAHLRLKGVIGAVLNPFVRR
jgi:putative transcriptional regulator